LAEGKFHQRLKHLKGITIMNTITNENISAFRAGEVPQSNDEKNDLDYLKAMKNHSMMGGAMVTMEEMMLMFTELAQGKFKQMQDKTAVGRDATDLANRVEGIIAKLGDDKSTAVLPKDVIDYMEKNNIQIAGKSVKEYLASAGGSGAKLDKAQLEEFKGALESTATRATDFVQSSQLKLQQLMQSFNTAVAMANAVQSMNGESTKSIAQSIR
jgi:secreted effector protein SseB